MELKTCSKCVQELSLSDFYADKTRKDGRATVCIACERSRLNSNYALYRYTNNCADCGNLITCGAKRCRQCAYKFISKQSFRLCSVDGCSNPHASKEYCSKHYKQYLRNGQILALNPRDYRPPVVEDGVAKIPLRVGAKGGYVIVDIGDAEWLSQWNWYRGYKDGYAVRTDYIGIENGKQIAGRVLMHRLIMGTPEGLEIDHKDTNRLNNRRSNLRIVTRQQNTFNRSIQSNNTSGYTGVYQRKDTKRWQAYIKCDGKRIHIGYFDTAEEAAYVYDQFCLQLFGEYARCNIL